MMNPENGVKCSNRGKAHMPNERAKPANPIMNIVVNALARKIFRQPLLWLVLGCGKSLVG